MQVTVGLYRHFKGGYYFVKEIVKDCNSGIHLVSYIDILNVHLGTFVRPLDDFNAEFYIKDNKIELIKDREDNVTGQHYRFERVKSLDNQVKNLSTNSLIEELRSREDSPLQKLDIDGLNDRVFCSDYVVGIPHLADLDKNTPRGVENIVTCTTEEEAKKYLLSHKTRKGTSVYKRTFIKVD